MPNIYLKKKEEEEEEKSNNIQAFKRFWIIW